MRTISLVLLLGVVAILFCPVTSNTHDDVKALLTNIFTTNSYNKMVRPSADQSLPTVMYVNLNLVGITDIDEVQEKMSSTAFLELYWINDYINWDPSADNDTEVIYVPQKNIWKPDIALENGFTKLKELGDDFLLTTIYAEGLVNWRPYEVFETKCSINIQYFPFDKQTCDIKFGVWTSPLSDVDVELGSKGILLDEYQTNGEWDLLTTSAKSSESQQEGAIVTFSITVKRKPQYILYNVVLPIIMLSLLSVFVFALPVDSGEKMGYIMTLYLAFAVFLTIVSASLPVSSSMSLLSLYLILLLSLGTAIVMITTLELRLHYRDTEVPMLAKMIVRLSKALRCHKSNKKVQDLSKIEATVSNGKGKMGKSPLEDQAKLSPVKPFVELELTWPDVTSAIDFFCFWFFLVANIVITDSVFVDGFFKSKS
ncbi:acetylcholine receptor subunit alpha-type unc-38-like [Mizuhopecten yessoensis]|uniref:acetylcholine receptor subunit alpha-type unc-38-like n=1 Tax=Mizuhopecten yessoensis TaxID=6573 RepID=UPI000B458D01|nr:acetylcholine receptor subunit alpha-type unc-38-like [Mizuhopecten yessoensis]